MVLRREYLPLVGHLQCRASGAAAVGGGPVGGGGNMNGGRGRGTGTRPGGVSESEYNPDSNESVKLFSGRESRLIRFSA